MERFRREDETNARDRRAHARSAGTRSVVSQIFRVSGEGKNLGGGAKIGRRGACAPRSGEGAKCCVVMLSFCNMDKAQDSRGELVIQTIAMPRDTNRNGDIFGGWLVSQMDLGGAILASKISKARVVTVAMEAMSFLAPVRVGDTVACYARIDRVG